MFSVTQILLEKFNIEASPGTKINCPICQHKNCVNITKDDSLAYCHYPNCTFRITAQSHLKTEEQKALDKIYADLHNHLLEKNNEAYRYLIERKVRPDIIEKAMLGAVPNDYDTDIIPRKTIIPHWLAFFYTDKYFNIISIRFRKPFDKKITWYKPDKKRSGIFGLSLIENSECDNILAFEGEFNALTIHNITSGIIPCCATGPAGSPDWRTLKSLNKKITICHDNDAAGRSMLQTILDHMSCHAITTPPGVKDMDEYVIKKEAELSDVQQLIAQRTFHSRSYQSVSAEINNLRLNKGKPKLTELEINQAVTDIILNHLLERGKFYRDRHNIYHFDRIEKTLLPLYEDNGDLLHLLDKYNINGADKIYKFVHNKLKCRALNEKETNRIRRLSFFDKDTFTLYVNIGDNEMIRIAPGEDPVRLNNGTDEVLFVYDRDMVPVNVNLSATADRSPTTDNLIYDLIVAPINFAEDVLTVSERRLLFEYWIYALFFRDILPTMPICAFIGEKDSGKSTAIKQVGLLLEGCEYQLTQMPEKSEDFDAIVTNHAFVAIDNADSKRDWLNDRLAVLATGGSIEKRTLYTTNEITKIKLQTSLAITSRTPKFGRTDVADRLLLLKVNPLEKKISAEEMQQSILSQRDLIWNSLIEKLKDIVNDIFLTRDLKITHTARMMDFARFMLRIGHQHKIESEIDDLLKKLSRETGNFALEGNFLYQIFCEWYEDGHRNTEITGPELLEKFQEIAKRRNIKFSMSPGQFRVAFKILRTDLKNEFEITEKIRHGNTKFYAFRKLALGENPPGENPPEPKNETGQIPF